MDQELQSVVAIVGAAVGGAAIGVERQWSGHATGPGAHFGGVRTFTLLGGFAGLAGWLWSAGYEPLAAILLAAAAGLIVAAYAAASRRDVDGTTEVAALVVLGAGVAAGTGRLALASGIVAVTWLLLVEKSRLHALVARLDDAEMRAAARFAVMAIVVLPLLPPGPYGPLGGVRPRELWALVLLFSGIAFAGYVARRAVGAQHGYTVTGLLGGLISSTSVTLAFARASRGEHHATSSLAFGVIAACTVMLLRVVVATAILAPAVARSLLAYVAAPFAVGLALLAMSRGRSHEAPRATAPANPLQFRAAIEMAALFQVVLFVVHLARTWWGSMGLAVSGVVLGLTDVDALTISMVKSVGTGVTPAVAARTIALGIIANTLLKLVVAFVIGRARFRRLAPAGLAAMAVAAGVSVVFLR